MTDELYKPQSQKRPCYTTLQFYPESIEEVRAHDNVVLAVSIPASELEMTVEDQSEYSRFKKLLDRVGKASSCLPRKKPPRLFAVVF